MKIKIKIELECELEIDGWVVLRILMDHVNAHMHWNFIFCWDNWGKYLVFVVHVLVFHYTTDSCQQIVGLGGCCFHG